ncbi:MAG: DUF4397 domain-containing protein, partial [Gemmatimonadetes bacterium]|nr:DUF4397 domain-containing protein [Gemmatimonadota bacterium]
MRRMNTLAVLVLAAVVASACRPAEVIKTVSPPSAGVRFINAVPDSSGAFGLDMRFVDIVENNVFFRITYRNGPATTAGVTASALTQFRPARAGVRHFRIFLDDTLQAITSTVLKDTSVTLEVGKNYTAMLWGEARLGTMKLTFFEDVPADPGTSVAMRVINATNAAIDASYYVSGGAAPGTPTWPSIPAYSASSFSTAAVGSYLYRVRAAGSGANMFNDVTALKGANADLIVGLDPTPGTLQAGSAVTLVVYPRSTAGARTPQSSAFTVPAGVNMWDRRP